CIAGSSPSATLRRPATRPDPNSSIMGARWHPRRVIARAHVRNRPRAALVLASALMLFTELALIRWIAAYVVYVAYFTNFVLLASFLGVGLGFLRAHRRESDFRRMPLALAAIVLLVALFPVTISHIGGGRVFVGLFGVAALPS